jgi:uncharacterized protein (UPF0276 family)
MSLVPQPRAGGVAGAPIPAAAGIGLRFPHHDQVLTERPDVAWLEVHPENYIGCAPATEILTGIRCDYPLSLHATGLSLGSAHGLAPARLAALCEFARRLQPGLISDHLSWSVGGGLRLPDLLPLPYTEEALTVMVRLVDQAQTALGRVLLIENPSTYLRFAQSSLSEAEFLAELVRRTGCGVLLDLNNVFVSAGNLGADPARRLQDLLQALPGQAIGEIHLAGHATRRLDGGVLLRIDDHGSPVSQPVWALFEAVVAQLGPRPTLIEWDTDIPAFETLQAEAAIAQAALRTPVRRVMRSLADLQGLMARGLLEDPTVLPPDLFAAGPIPAAVALKVHRNTVFSALSHALAITYPTILALVGEAFFDQAVVAYAEHRPPCESGLAAYGDAFAEFIEGFAPAAGLAYLADVARLDLAIERCANAARLDRLISIDAATWLSLPVSLAAIELRHPADLIREALDAGGPDALAAIDPAPARRWIAVWRSGDGAGSRSLSGPAGRFLAALQAGRAADAALVAASADDGLEAALLAIQAEVFAAPFARVIHPSFEDQPS